jgi:endoglucanase
MSRVLTLLVSPLLALPLASAAGAANGVEGFVRVDQVGYATQETKQAFLMTANPVSGESYEVVSTTGEVAASGSIGASNASWSSAYQAVYPIDFSTVRTPGLYVLRVSGPAAAQSGTFRIDDTVISSRLPDFVKFYRTQRDGLDVPPGQLDRQPSHANLQHATVYANPTFVHDDVIAEPQLRKIGGPVDVSGGWFDAGDYLKFVHNNAYADAVMFYGARSQGAAASPELRAEAHFGLDWLDKMWDAQKKVLYFQVGIGSGDQGGHFSGDHDVWRLPEADDGDTRPADRYIRNAPVFRANAPGERISPNLVGRVSAAFALAAQLDAATQPAQAQSELDKAAALYAVAKTTNVGQLVTALPNEFYPESSWKDDMEFGGAELALAGQALNDPRTTGWLQQSAHWARAYLANPTTDTLNLYDTSALGHADLARAIRASGRSDLEVAQPDLVAGLRRQLDHAAAHAAADPFAVGSNEADFDVDSHSFGVFATSALYRGLTSSSAYDALGTAQRNWVLGANAWGSSFVVGFGELFPHCVAGQLPNISGSLDGSHPYQLGAVVNGPNNVDNFTGKGHTVDPGYLPAMRHCGDAHNDPFAAFTGANQSKYTDDVRSWQTSEEAVDMSGSALLAYALNS